jgi:hypothetical protein
MSAVLEAPHVGRARVLRRPLTGHDILFVLWVAFIAADRVDLAGRAGGFVLRPYLVLTPLVMVSELHRRAKLRRPVTLPRGGTAFLALTLALLALVCASVFVSQETTVSAGRAMLLLADLTGALAVTIVASDREDFRSLMDRASVAGILLYAAFDVAQLASLVGWLPETAHVGPAAILLYPSTYGGIVPRLSGMVIDQNRSGFALLFFGWWVALRPGGRPRSGYVALVLLMMALTLSRSGAVAALATFGMLLLERRVRWVPRRSLLALGVVASASMTLFLVSPRARHTASTALEPFAQRLSVGEGSSQAHLTLIERGFSVATSSLPNLGLGIGYGSAYTVLQDVFPGNRYGSFHSLYVTTFAETGLFGLLCVLVMLGVPVVRGGPYRSLIAGAAVFNLFYQATTDPAFWMILSLAWLTLPPRATAGRVGAGRVREGMTRLKVWKA